jgi:hypothetical protein
MLTVRITGFLNFVNRPEFRIQDDGQSAETQLLPTKLARDMIKRLINLLTF